MFYFLLKMVSKTNNYDETIEGDERYYQKTL